MRRRFHRRDAEDAEDAERNSIFWVTEEAREKKKKKKKKQQKKKLEKGVGCVRFAGR